MATVVVPQDGAPGVPSSVSSLRTAGQAACAADLQAHHEDCIIVAEELAGVRACLLAVSVRRRQVAQCLKLLAQRKARTVDVTEQAAVEAEIAAARADPPGAPGDVGRLAGDLSAVAGRAGVPDRSRHDVDVSLRGVRGDSVSAAAPTITQAHA